MIQIAGRTAYRLGTPCARLGVPVPIPYDAIEIASDYSQIKYLEEYYLEIEQD